MVLARHAKSVRSNKSEPPAIHVLAGTNGAGKSSVGGAAFRLAGMEYFNPDEVARALRDLQPWRSAEQANGLAWTKGRELLERAIAERMDFAFETTLGGKSITELLELAAATGMLVRIWYVGLASVELHLKRVKARVVRGGHDIPEHKIRERFDSSRLNLIRLLPALNELRLYDNSTDGDPAKHLRPSPKLLLHLRARSVITVADTRAMPLWARPIVMAALDVAESLE